jgi:steroid delta-isomerase-like uncharacterized protein
MTNNFLTYIQNLTDAWNSHDLELVLPFYSEHYEGVDIGEPQLQHGREAVRKMLLYYWKAFPDLKFYVVSTVAEENHIAISWQAEGTHHGSIMNIPPTGRKVQVKGVSVIEVKDGLVTRGEYIWDLAGMLRHMGLLPEL